MGVPVDGGAAPDSRRDGIAVKPDRRVLTRLRREIRMKSLRVTLLADVLGLASSAAPAQSTRTPGEHARKVLQGGGPLDRHERARHPVSPP